MKKLLALNRGEIAIRILRAANELKLKTVAVFSQEDRLSLHRFKADEASQTITGPYRQEHPEDNNERQAIHEHVSVPLPLLAQKAAARKVQWKAVSRASLGTGR